MLGMLSVPEIFTVSAPLALPIWIVLLAETTAPDPIAVAKVRLAELASAEPPTKVLFEPVVFVDPADLPRKTLVAPVVLAWPADLPKKALLNPVVFAEPAEVPKNELSPPLIVEPPASNPKNELLTAVVLAAPADDPKNEFCCPVVLAVPAPTPAKMFPVPPTLNTALPPMLYCVLVLMIGILSVPEILTVSEPFALPSWIVLLVETTAPEPIAVAKLRPPEPAFVESPMKVLFEPVVFDAPADWPKNALPPPVVFAEPAR